jgi:hypothetical protein
MRKIFKHYPSLLTKFQYSHLIVIIGLLFLPLYQIIIENTVQYNNNIQEVIAQPNITNNQKSIEDNVFLYVNQSYIIKVKYPSNWEKVKANSSDNIVIFRIIPDNSSDKFIPGVGIYVHDLPYREIPMEEYNNIEIDLLKKSFNLINSNTTTLAKLPAHKAIYTDPSKGITALQIWTIKDDYIYKIIYLANLKQYANYLLYAERIINSFEIIPFNLTKLLRD